MINNYFEDEQYHSSNSIYLHPVYRNQLHLGDMSSAQDLQFLQKHNIKTVITAAANMDHIQYGPQHSIKHIVYPLLDIKSQNIGTLFNPVHQLIQKQLQNGSVLVHCAAGISRSATLVIAYLMKHKMWGFRQAISFVRENRSKACPNLGFQRQLKEYQRVIFGKKSSQIERRVPKTSEQHKHISKPTHIELPQIGSLGRTQTRNIVLNSFFQRSPTYPVRVIQRNRQARIKEEYLPLQLKPLRPIRKARSLAQREREQTKTQRQKQILTPGFSLGIHSVLRTKVKDKDAEIDSPISPTRRRPQRLQNLNFFNY